MLYKNINVILKNVQRNVPAQIPILKLIFSICIMPTWVSLSVPTKITCKRKTEYNISPIYLYAAGGFLYPNTEAIYTQIVPCMEY